MIHFLTGVVGAGKSTLVHPLVAAMPGVVVLDMDELLDARGEVLGVPIAVEEGAPNWPAYNALWVQIADLVARSHPVLLLGPLLPWEWVAAGGSADTPFALLDCPDEVRRARLRARGWQDADLVHGLADAAAARGELAVRISTDCPVDATVAAVVRWLQQA